MSLVEQKRLWSSAPWYLARLRSLAVRVPQLSQVPQLSSGQAPWWWSAELWSSFGLWSSVQVSSS